MYVDYQTKKSDVEGYKTIRFMDSVHNEHQ